MLRKRSLSLITGLGASLCLALVGLAMGDPLANHFVTVTVLALNEIAINEGDLALTIHGPYAGTECDGQMGQSAAELHWISTGTDKKITVSTDLMSNDDTLKVVAQNVSGGALAAEVTLDDADAHNFVTGIRGNTGSCDLKYTYSASSPTRSGVGIHIVTYTFTDAF